MRMEENKGDVCEICGEKLKYTGSSENYKDFQCYFCKKDFSVNTYCPNGHYICDACHSKDPIRIIEEFCEKTELKDPFMIAELIMEHPKFKMYGPEHHALVPAVFLTALKNNNVKKLNGEQITFSDIKEGINRASKIPGGWCGFYGSCGAGMGSGIVVSIFTSANPSRDIPRTLANKMTSRSLKSIADNLEHCCKRSVRIALIELVRFFKAEFSIILDYKPDHCTFSNKNDKCEKQKCFLF